MPTSRVAWLTIPLLMFVAMLAGCFHEPSNVPPTVSIDAQPVSGTAPLEVSFSSSASDPDGVIVLFVWSFGDGQSKRGRNVSHTYAEPGTYTVTLTVEDDEGTTSQATKTIEVQDTGCRGESDEIDTLHVELTDVRMTRSIPPFRAADNKTFAVVDLTVEAKENNLTVDIFNFQVAKSDGETATPASASRGLDNLLESTTLNAGESVSGKLAFEVPIENTDLKLQYDGQSGNQINICLPET